MTSTAETTLLAWLHRRAGFPRVRLPAPAERLLCFAAAAEQEAAAEAAERSGGGRIVRQDAAAAAAQKQHALRRSRVHYKCDNSAKV